MRNIRQSRLVPHTEDIIKRYKSGESVTLIGKVYDIHRHSISKLLKRNGIKVNVEQRLINYNPFEDLENEEVQYWLGYIMADGNLFDKRISLHQTEKDIDILKNYCDFLGIGYENIKPKKRTNLNWDALYTVRFGHLETYNFLKSIGITENKSHALNITIPMSFPMLRGLIEGDGCIRIGNKNTTSVNFVTASSYLSDQIKHFLTENGIRFYFTDASINYINVTSIYTKKLIELIYTENVFPYNKRKFTKAQEIIKLVDEIAERKTIKYCEICELKAISRNLCNTHYHQWLREMKRTYGVNQLSEIETIERSIT